MFMRKDASKPGNQPENNLAAKLAGRMKAAFEIPDMAAITRHLATPVGGGLAGAAIGGINGALSPGQDAEGKERSMLSGALRGAGMGGAVGAGLGAGAQYMGAGPVAPQPSVPQKGMFPDTGLNPLDKPAVPLPTEQVPPAPSPAAPELHTEPQQTKHEFIRQMLRRTQGGV